MHNKSTAYKHINLQKKGQAYIEGTKTKVSELIVEKLAYGWDAETLSLQHGYLTLGQIYSALAFYYDHQKEMDALIKAELSVFDKKVRNIKPTSFLNKLKTSKTWYIQ
ncbi:MAG: DUF433 domain-containing protein [Chitinophagales bacterium]